MRHNLRSYRRSISLWLSCRYYGLVLLYRQLHTLMWQQLGKWIVLFASQVHNNLFLRTLLVRLERVTTNSNFHNTPTFCIVTLEIFLLEQQSSIHGQSPDYTNEKDNPNSPLKPTAYSNYHLK